MKFITIRYTQSQIGVAGDLAEGFVDHLETCLKKI